jgi:hypothetical protein
VSAYDLESLHDLLEAVWDRDYTDPRASRPIHGEEGRQAHTKGYTNGDGMNRVVAAADVRRCWACLDKDERELLAARHYYDFGLDDVTRVFGLEDVQEAADLIRLAEVRLVDYLNGRWERG